MIQAYRSRSGATLVRRREEAPLAGEAPLAETRRSTRLDSMFEASDNPLFDCRPGSQRQDGLPLDQVFTRARARAGSKNFLSLLLAFLKRNRYLCKEMFW